MGKTNDLLTSIEQFCQRHDLTESRFGRLALNDTSFVKDLRNGRAPTTRTVEKVLRFVAYRDARGTA